MAKAIAVTVPKWVTDFKEQIKEASVYGLIPKLMQWTTVELMERELLQQAAGAGIQFHLETLFAEVKKCAAENANTHPLVARLSLSAFVQKQIFLTIATDEKKPVILDTYVLRTTEAGLIEGVRRAAEHQH